MDAKPTNPKDAIGVTKPSMSCISGAFLCEFLATRGIVYAEVNAPAGFFPAAFLTGIGNAMLEGALKYARHNYRAAGVRASVYFDAAWRHGLRHLAGEAVDPDSGLPHLAKAGACIAVIYDSITMGNWVDDRPPRISEPWTRGEPAGPVVVALSTLCQWWEGGDRELLVRAALLLSLAYPQPAGWVELAQEDCARLLAKYPEDARKAPFTELGRVRK